MLTALIQLGVGSFLQALQRFQAVGMTQSHLHGAHMLEPHEVSLVPDRLWPGHDPHQGGELVFVWHGKRVYSTVPSAHTPARDLS